MKSLNRSGGKTSRCEKDWPSLLPAYRTTWQSRPEKLPTFDPFTAPGIQRKHKYYNSISHIFLHGQVFPGSPVLPSVFCHWSYHMSRRQSWLRTGARIRTTRLRISRPGESILGKQTLKTAQNGYNDAYVIGYLDTRTEATLQQ